MTPMLVAAGAAVGAVLRYLAGHLGDDGFPTGTLAVNLLGSLGLGALVASDPTASALALLGTGVCGGLTTFSAFAVRTVGEGPRRGTAYAVVTVAGSVAACALGFAVVDLLR